MKTPPSNLPPAEHPANAGLDQLAGVAAAADLATADIENPGAPEAEAVPAAPDYATEASGLTDIVAALITGYEPRTVPLWGDERKAQIAAALAPVMQKYNLTLGNMPPELTLLVMAGPPLYQSMRIIAERMKPQQGKQSEGATKAEQRPIITPETVEGTATHSPAMMNLK